ncbi:phage tail protein [Variovorax sp. NFACC27]|uniref:phage tail protein n=1 Tax=unclassified Variovorax TaxID=663243 RepID=UPI00089AF603|nr:Microcystin-dependent protein [Variovorax sp. NFACC28]SEF71375.1 Microcystin-dependent protein [Variovorax sp. NFACC29]SFB76797.1 Microcystin-dependent protein [Variovorax sp. NFACC26]SFG76440.1 Microcystin-dependent protein [Variovorax sp. NFACC27]
MAVITDINSLSTNPSSNGPDGAVDPPSALDDQLRYHGAFIAQLRDGLGMPVGALLAFAGTVGTPTGWIKANGALVSRTTYAALFAYASSQGLVSEAAWTSTSSGRFSVGDGSTTFRLPDTRGMFIRGLDESRGLDASRVVGTYQEQANAPHTHSVTDSGHIHGDTGHSHGGFTDSQGSHQHGYSGWTSTGVVAASGLTSATVYAPTAAATDAAGSHAHNIATDVRTSNLLASATGISIQSQGSEGRPRNIAYPMFIKY